MGKHADMIDTKDFKRFLKILPDRSIDLILEVKVEDRALLKLR